MKKIITYLILAIFSTGLISCNMDEEPYGFYSDANFYKTPEDAMSALYYAYNSMTYLEYWRAIYYLGELASETCQLKPNEGFGTQEIEAWDYTTFSNNEQLFNYFKNCYIAINRTNAIIQNVGESPIGQELKTKIIGEAYFLRGFIYFGLTKMFGLVPIQTKMVATISQTTPSLAKSFDEQLDFIIKDCEKAEGMLKVNRIVGRVDKVAAQSLLSKIYIYMASAKESNRPLFRELSMDVNEMYKLAAEWSGKVLYEQSEYSFDDNLKNIYDITKSKGPEHIFLLSMDRSGNQDREFSSVHMMFLPWNNQRPLWFKNNDGSFTKASYGWETIYPNQDFINSFNPADKRLKDLFTNVYYTEANDAGFFENFYYITLKYNDPNFIGVKSSVKPYLIRFSDIALTYAEASGPNDEGYKWLNKIRNRAGLSDAPTGMSAAQFRNYVVQERAFEMVMEGDRLFDLRRKGIVTTTDPMAGASGITEDEAMFYPLPQREVDLNPNVREK